MGKYFGIEARTGRIRWEYDIGADGPQRSFHGAALFVQDLVVVSTDNTFRQEGIGHVYAFEQATGRVRWKYRSPSGISTDVVRDGDRVYAASLSDVLVCLGLNDGRELWRFSTGAENKVGKDGRFREPLSPVAADGRVFFGGLDQKVRALDARTGEVIWEREFSSAVSAGPGLHHDRLYLGTLEPRLYELDPKSGDVVRRLELPRTPGGAVVFDDGSLFVCLGRKVLAAISADLQGIVWQQETAAEWTASRPALTGTEVVTGDSAGELAAFATRDGRPVWRCRFAGEDIRSVTVADSVCYVGTIDGTLYAWRPLLSAQPRTDTQPGTRAAPP